MKSRSFFVYIPTALPAGVNGHYCEASKTTVMLERRFVIAG